MKTPSLLKTSVAIATVITLSACSNMQRTGVLNDLELAQQDVSSQFAHTLQHEEWLADEYRSYLSKNGYKAFAVYWDDSGIPYASGYSDDKLSMSLARKEALRLCQAYAQTENSGCRIEDEEATSRKQLNPKDYPNEVIAYRDVGHWEEYQTISGHKAIAGNQAGIQSGSKGDTQAEAEEKALEQCYQHTHFSMPTCYTIASE